MSDHDFQILRTAMVYTGLSTIGELDEFCRKYALTPTVIAARAKLDGRALNEVHEDVFEGMPFQEQRDLVTEAYRRMAGDTPTREELIAVRLLTTPYVFDEDAQGEVIADYTTVLRLAEAFGEQMLGAIEEHIDLCEYFANRGAES